MHFFDNSLIIKSILHEIEGKFLGFKHMWNDKISLYILFKEMEKLGWRNHTKVRSKPYVKTQL
jgi:hypothetical protein